MAPTEYKNRSSIQKVYIYISRNTQPTMSGQTDELAHQEENKVDIHLPC